MARACLPQLTDACHDTIRYMNVNMNVNVRSKADMTQLNLPHGNNN